METKEQPNKDSKEQVTEEVTKTTQPDKEVAEKSVNLFEDYEQERKAFVPAPEKPAGKDEKVLPAQKVETKPEIKTEPEVKPKVEGTPEVKPEGEIPEGEVKPLIERVKDWTIKRKDENIPVLEILDEFDKAGQLQDFFNDYTSKKFDYFRKTQDNSRDRDEWHKERDLNNQMVEAIQLENLANEIDERNLKDISFFKNAVNDEGELVYEEPEKALKKYQEGVREKATQYTDNANKAMGMNQQYLAAFANKYSLDAEYVEKELLPLINQYLQPSIAKRQQPFKEDTFEVFYRGINYEPMVKVEKENSFKEGQKSAYTEIKETKEKAEQPIQSSQEVQAQPTPGFEDYEAELSKYTNN